MINIVLLCCTWSCCSTSRVQVRRADWWLCRCFRWWGCNQSNAWLRWRTILLQLEALLDEADAGEEGRLLVLQVHEAVMFAKADGECAGGLCAAAEGVAGRGRSWWATSRYVVSAAEQSCFSTF